MWHDNAGASPSWFLSSVTVRDFQSNKTYYFLCDCWLALDKEGGVIEREIPVAGELKVTERKIPVAGGSVVGPSFSKNTVFPDTTELL